MIDKIRSAASSVPRVVGSAALAVPRVAGSAASSVPRVVSSAAASVPRAAGSLYDRVIDRVLSRPHQVASADAAKALLEDPDSIDVSAFADQIQQVAIIALPIARRVGMLRKVPGVKRVPWVLSLVTVANVARAIRQGVREVQVVGSYLATRLEATTGEPPDPALVKALTVQLYLSPSRRPSAADTGVPAGRLLRRWLTYGLVGRTTNKSALRAIDAIEAMDVPKLLAG
jgi:hypothetical protein